MKDASNDISSIESGLTASPTRLAQKDGWLQLQGFFQVHTKDG
jgi:hypothetical protein